MDAINEIKRAAWYRGQALTLPSGVYKPLEQGDVTINKPEIEFILNGLKSITGNDKFMRHQAEAINAWIKKRSFLITTPAGSGRRTLISLISLACVVCRGGRVLALTPNEQSATEIAEYINEISKLRNLSSVVHLRQCVTSDELATSISSGSSIIVTPAKTAFETIKNSTKQGMTGAWLRTLSFASFASMGLFRPPELCHIRLLIRLISTLSPDCSFALLTPLMDSPEQFCGELFGKHIANDIISIETSSKSEHACMLWHPPLNAHARGEPGEYSIKRANYIDETIAVISELCKNPAIIKVLIWCATVELDDSHRRKLRESIKTSIAPDVPSPPSIDVINHPEECPSAMMRQYDLIILLGLSNPLSSVRQQFGNLIKDNGIVIIIVPEDPLSFSQYRRPEIERFLPHHIHFEIPRSETASLLYLDILRRLNPYAYFTCDQILRIVSKEIFNQLIERSVIIQNSVTYYSLKKISSVENVRWGQIDCETVALIDEDGNTYNLDKYLIPFVIHNGGVISLNGKMSRVNTVENSLAYSPEDHAITTIPCLSHQFAILANRETKSLGFEQKQLQIRYVDCELTTSELGYWSLRDYSTLERTDEIMHGESSQHTRISRGILIESPHGSELAIMLWQYLRSRFSQLDEMAITLDTKDGVLIVALHKSYYPLIEQLYGSDHLMSDFLNFAYNTLIACPCLAGCPRCLQHNLRLIRTPIDKYGVLKHIANLINKNDFEEDWAYKDKGLRQEQASKRYERERHLILRLFNERFDLLIKNPVPIYADESLEGMAGVYCSDNVKILSPLPEARALQVIAHEYGHNWEFDPGGSNISFQVTGSEIPFGGKLISEGFAEWVAFKICDHLALIDEARAIDMRVDDEYGEGFDFLNWVENTLPAGYQGVIDLVKEGKISMADGSLKDIIDLLSEFKESPR